MAGSAAVASEVRPRRFGGDRCGSEDENDSVAVAGSVGGVVNPDELETVATRFGVARAQLEEAVADRRLEIRLGPCSATDHGLLEC